MDSWTQLTFGANCELKELDRMLNDALERSPLGGRIGGYNGCGICLRLPCHALWPVSHRQTMYDDPDETRKELKSPGNLALFEHYLQGDSNDFDQAISLDSKQWSGSNWWSPIV
jgi:hypothetical protein